MTQPAMHGAFSASIRITGEYRLPVPESYPGGADRYLQDAAREAADAFVSYLIWGRADSVRIRVVQELERARLPGAIA